MTGTAVNFSAFDWGIVALYFIANTAICIWAVMAKGKNTEDYFLASRSAGWFLIGSSIFASNIGAEHLIGLAGSGAQDGMAFAHWELHSYLVLVLGWVFAPFYLRANVFTTPEFLERRYNPATRTFLSFIFLVSYILTKASVTIFAGAFAIQTILGYETITLPLFGETDFFWFSAMALVVVTGVFVVFGGMRSVLWTEAMHVPVLLAGSTVLLVVGLNAIGGLDALKAANPDTIHLWRPLSTTPETQGFPGFLFDPSATPWLGVLLCSPIIGLWYWCTDQYIVQRVLTARGLQAGASRHHLRGVSEARARVHFPAARHDRRGFVQTGHARLRKHRHESAGRFPGAGLEHAARRPAWAGAGRHVVGAHERAGVAVQLHRHAVHRGLLQAPASDILRAAPGERGRLATAGIIVLGMLWIPLLQGISKYGLYGYLQLVQSLLAPSIAAVFMAASSPASHAQVRPVGPGAGFVFGMLRLALQATHELGGVKFPGFIQAYVDMNWLYFSFLLFVFTCAVIFVVSQFTPKASTEQLAGLTYSSISAQNQADDRGRTASGRSSTPS